MSHGSSEDRVVAVLLALVGLFLLAPRASADVVSLGQAANYALSDGAYIKITPNPSGEVLPPLTTGTTGQFDWTNPAAISGTVFEITNVVTTSPVGGFTFGSADPTVNLSPDGSFIVGDSGKFVIDGAANLLLTGGLSSPELFAIVSNGGDVSLGGNTNNLVTGTILALSRNISSNSPTISDPTSTGVVIGGFSSTNTNPFIKDLSQFQLQYQSFSPSDAEAPEPGTLLLFGAGLGGMALIIRRRQRQMQTVPKTPQIKA